MSLSKETLDRYFNTIFKDLIKFKENEVAINFEKYELLNKDAKLALINKSVKQLKNNYYDLRSKKIDNLISNLKTKTLKNLPWEDVFFIKKMAIYALNLKNHIIVRKIRCFLSYLQLIKI